MNQKILAKIQEQMTEGLYQGASLSLYQEGKWTDYFLGESEPGRPTRANLIYDLASVSKVVGVGTLLLFLIAEGRVQLDAPLATYYPAFQDDSVTIRQLVTHTSGLDPYIPHRDRLDALELRQTMNRLKVTEERVFRYTDVNLILLGFMLEELLGEDLDKLIEAHVCAPWGLKETGFFPVEQERAVPTVAGQVAGRVHDPKAQVLGVHTGSAGLFSTVADLKRFLHHYLVDDIAANLATNLNKEQGKPRSLVWNLEADGWLDHTGYTGPFLLLHRRKQKAAIFLTNRTYYEDNRPLWIAKRGELLDIIKDTL